MKVSLFVVIVVLFASPVFAQDDLHQTLREVQKAKDTDQNDDAIKYYKLAISLAEKDNLVHKKCNISAGLASLYYNVGEYKNASDLCEKAILSFEENKLIGDTTLFKLYSVQAPSYKNQYLSQKAIESYLQGDILLDKHPEIKEQLPLFAGYHYHNQGIFWLKLHDVNRAQSLFQQALAIGLSLEKDALIVDASINLGSILSYQKDLKQGIQLLKEALSLLNASQDIEFLDLARCKLLLADLLEKDDQSLEANKLLESIIAEKQQLQAEIVGKDVYVQAVLTRAKAFNYREGQVFLEKIENPKVLPKHLQGEYFITAGELAHNEARYKQSIVFYNEAINSLQLTFDSTWKSIDLIKSFKAVSRLAKVQYDRYKTDANSDFLKQAVKDSRKALSIADEIRENHFTFESKLFFSEKNFSEYKRTINLLYEIYLTEKQGEDLYELFNVAEKSKSYLMNIYQIRNGHFRNKQEDSLSMKLNAYQKYLSYLKGKNSPVEEIDKIQQKANLILSELFKTTNKSPKLRSDYTVFTEDIARIPSDQAYVNYLLDDSQLLILCIADGEIRINSVPVNTDSLNNHIKKLQRALHTPPSPYTGFKEFSSCQYLYKLLIDNIPFDLDSYARLAINPDNELFDFSFDILQNPKTKAYLIEEVALSYVVSIDDLLIENNGEEVSSDCNIFMPFADESLTMLEGLKPLKFSLEQAKGILGDFYLNLQAEKNVFLDKIKDSTRVTILSTHAALGDKEPYLIFNTDNEVDSKLYASELPYLNVKTPLLILNACESNSGKKVNGMGLFSLVEAFRLAGGQSVLGSMWKADEESTAMISSLFYRNVMKGMTKDQALQQAKLDFLKTEEGLRNDTPFYWSHLQIVGDTSSIRKKTTIYYWLFGVVVIGLFLFIQKRFFKKS